MHVRLKTALVNVVLSSTFDMFVDDFDASSNEWFS
jgi:hypothetical protein